MKKTARAFMAALLSITMATGGFPAAALAEETSAATEASAQQEIAANDQGTAGEPSADSGTKNAAEAEQFAGANDAAKQPTGAGDVAKKPEPETASPESATDELAAQSLENAIAPTATTTTYAHTETAEQNGVTLTLGWNDASAGEPTTFHLSATGGSGAYKFRMDAPFYMNPGEGYFGEMVADTSRGQWMTWTSSDTGCDYEFTMTASGRYYYRFYLQDAQSSVWSLRVAAETEISDDAHPSIDQIVTNAVAQCRQETSGSEYDMALWLHDWTLDQLEYDHNLNWCSAESGLTRHQGTCESYQRIYAKLLNAAGIANGRITGNGHTWNAVKIDGKWCQMDLTWDDTNDNWYGDLDQRHLYFGLTDELMAIAHSDHTATYQKDGYAYRSTDLSNDYFVRNGKANEWAGAYADRIQQHLNAKETEFSIDADNGTIPPSISGIQNAIVAYAMNQREWSNADGAVTLTAASNVTTVSSYEWSARFDFEVEYPVVALIPDGSYKIMSTIDAASGVTISESSCSMTKAPRALYFKFDASTARYSITANGKALTMTGAELSLTESDGSTSQQWSLVEAGGGYAIVNAATGNALDDRWRDTGEGALVWGYASSLGDPAQTWALTAPAAQVIEDGQYRIMSSINDSMGVSAFENGCTLSSAAGCLEFSFDADKGFYTLISADGKALTMSGTNLSLATPDGSASQQWSVTAVEGGYAIVNAATGNALDDRWRDTGEGALVWGYWPSLGNQAQTWNLQAPETRTIEDGTYRVLSTLNPRLAVNTSASGSQMNAGAEAIRFERDASTGYYRLSKNGLELTAEGNTACMAKPNGSGAQLWKVRAVDGGYAIVNAANNMAIDAKWCTAAEGSEVWLYSANGTAAQTWALAGIGSPAVADGAYSIMSVIDGTAGISASEQGCEMSQAPTRFEFGCSNKTGFYEITADGKALTMEGALLFLTSPDGSASQMWSVTAVEGGYAIVNAATGNALDDRWRDTGEGALVWGYASSLGDPAQTWAFVKAA